MEIGKKVILIPVCKNHLDSFVKWFNDNEITQYIAWFLPLNYEKEEKWYSSMLEQQNQINYSIVLSENQDSLIGNCNIQIDWKNRVGMIGIMIGEKEYWGKGYGTEALRMLVKYGFNTLNLNRIELETYAFNTRALKSYNKVGFKQEGLKRNSYFKNGKYIDSIIMGLLKEEWVEN